MVEFNKFQIESLSQCLYNCCVHDAKIENILFTESNKVVVNATNNIYNVKMKFVFGKVSLFNFVKGDWQGDNNTVLSLTIEDSHPFNQNNFSENSLILLFQMLSGDEIYIIAETVCVIQERQ